MPVWYGHLSSDEDLNMKAARQQAIVDLLTHHKSLTTEALSLQLNVSKETIRRDLSELQTQGKVLRNHGRAKAIHRENQDSGDPFHIRLKSHYAHKANIAREALAWIEEGMVIALDASSTCWYLARQLPDINIHVFTNSQPICQELAKREHIQLISSGGRLERKYGCYVNPSLISQLNPSILTCLFFPAKGSTATVRSGTQMQPTQTSNPFCLSAHRNLYC
jgi:DeoR family L-fucose operon activator